MQNINTDFWTELIQLMIIELTWQVGHVNGWKELLQSVGFRFEPAANGIPSSVFFPQSDPEERLTQCSASLQALLGQLHVNKLLQRLQWL